MNLTINGEATDVLDVQTLPQLLERLELPAPALLIEHNGVALHRKEWQTRLLAEGDRLEFLRITAGG